MSFFRTEIFIDTIILPSECLDLNLKQNLFEELRSKKEEKCTKETGYVSKVISIEKILQAYISRADGSNRFKIQYKAQISRLELNIKYIGTVINLFEEGIFVGIENFQVLVIESKPKQFEFDKKNNKIKVSCCVFAVKSKITFFLKTIQFRNKSFTYIGEHAH